MVQTNQFNPVPWSGGKVPDAFLPGRVGVGIVGAEYLPERGSDLVLAPALLAVVTVLVEREAVVAGAHVRADGIAAFLLATPIVYRTFVLV